MAPFLDGKCAFAPDLSQPKGLLVLRRVRLAEIFLGGILKNTACQPPGLILQALVQAPSLLRATLAVSLLGTIHPMQAAARAPAYSGQGKFLPVGTAKAVAVLVILEMFPAEFYARMGLACHWPDKKGNAMLCQYLMSQTKIIG